MSVIKSPTVASVPPPLYVTVVYAGVASVVSQYLTVRAPVMVVAVPAGVVTAVVSWLLLVWPPVKICEPL